MSLEHLAAIDLRKFGFNADNVLDIFEPDYYRCQLLEYSASHSVLTIKIYSNTHKHMDKTSFFAVFEGVDYLEAPRGWAGANIITSDEKEFKDVLYGVMGFPPEEGDVVFSGIENFGIKLFKLKLAPYNLQVRILASILNICV